MLERDRLRQRAAAIPIPEDVPEGFDTSLFPEVLGSLLHRTYEETRRAVWLADEALCGRYQACLDELARFVLGDQKMFLSARRSFWRKKYHPLLCRFYGIDSETAPELEDAQKASSGPGPWLFRQLVNAAQKIDPQPSHRESAIWVSEKMALVRADGWRAVRPNEVIGLFALEMLVSAVQEPFRFMREIYPKYVQIQKAESSEPEESESESGATVIGYIQSLRAELDGQG